MAQFLPYKPNEPHLLQINNSILAENTSRAQNEKQLYSARQQSEMDKKQLQTTIHNLNDQLKVMKLEIETLKLNQKPSEITSQADINDYGDLADDTKWVQVLNIRQKKKVGRSKITGTIYRK
jgi:hypothetical protein